MDEPSAIYRLALAIDKFGQNNPSRICHFVKGQRLINQGDTSTDCFLIKRGGVGIWVKHKSEDKELHVDMRYEGAVIGEIAFLQRNCPRTASVEIVSDSATFVRINKEDFFTIIRDDPTMGDAVSSLHKLANARIEQTNRITSGEIVVDFKPAAVIIADIHNFSMVGEVVYEEYLNSFLFDFIENSDDVISRSSGYFEEQGDGFKAVFDGELYIVNALNSAVQIIDDFKSLRDKWSKEDKRFNNIGIGIGVCANFMSVRTRVTSLSQKRRIYSHTINVASAISKYRMSATDTSVYIDEQTALLTTNIQGFAIGLPEPKVLDKLGRIANLSSVVKKDNSMLATHKNSVFVCYAHADNDDTDRNKRYLDRLLEQLGPLVLQNEVSVWSDKNLQIGDQWHESIQTAINEAKIAVLLISPSFLNSKYIRESELPSLLHSANERGLVILPVIVRECPFTRAYFNYPDPNNGPHKFMLGSMQAANPPDAPLNALSEHQQDKVLLSVAERIANIVRTT